MVALLLVAVSLGLSNFAAAVGLGVAGVDRRTRVRVGVVFGVFEAGMPVAGLLLWDGPAGTLGRTARWIGAGLLIATGLYALAQSVPDRSRGQPGVPAAPVPAAGLSLGRLLVTGLAL